MNDRVGETLWSEWDGMLYETTKKEPIIYYTYDHIDIENDIVKRALASAIQRDGIADSLKDAFDMIDRCLVIYAYSGYDEDEISPVVCDEQGETYYGDVIIDPKETTFIEI